MSTQMPEIPTAQYYTTTDHTVAKLIRLVAILSIVIGAAGLLDMIMILSRLLLGNLISSSWSFVSPIYRLDSLATWFFAPLRVLSGIGCLRRKDLARRGMVALAVLTIIYSAASTGLSCYFMIRARVYAPYGPGKTQFDQALFALYYTSGFIASLMLPLVVLTLFRSEPAKQFFKQGT